MDFQVFIEYWKKGGPRAASGTENGCLSASVDAGPGHREEQGGHSALRQRSRSGEGTFCRGRLPRTDWAFNQVDGGHDGTIACGEAANVKLRGWRLLVNPA